MRDGVVLALLFVVPFFAGVWVLRDARTRLGGGAGLAGLLWALGTAFPPTFPIFFPLYLLGARSPDASGAWGPAEILGIGVFFAILIPVIYAVAAIGPTPTLSELSVFVLLQNAGFVLMAVFGVAVRYRLPLARLGLTAPRWPLLAVLGLVVGVATPLLSYLAEEAAILVVSLVTGRSKALALAAAEHARDPIGPLLDTSGGWPAIALIALLLIILVPLGEEVYFRGVVFSGLRNRWGRGWAYVGSVLLFGVAHTQVIHFLPIALLGVILAALYDRTGSLLPPMIVHAVNNAVVVVSHLQGWNI